MAGMFIDVEVDPKVAARHENAEVGRPCGERRGERDGEDEGVNRAHLRFS